jgi:hypothetical protein
MSSSQSPDTPDDASIPLLTERLTLPPLELDTTLPVEPQGPSTSAPTMPLALDTSLPLGLPQPPPPLRPATVPARAAPAPAAAATVPARAAPAPAAAATIPARPPPIPAPAAATVPPKAAPVPAPAPATVSAARATVADTASTHWTRIELELRSSILQAIADALPQHVDNIVRTRMNDAVERLFTQLVAETRLAVAASLREIVDQAVRAELMRLRRQKP